MSTTELVVYSAACRAIAKACTTDEVKKIRNSASMLRAYAKQANNRQLEIDAAEIRIRAERRLGELVAKQKKTVGLAKGTLRRGSKMDPRDDKPTLAEAGIDKHLADRARKLARVPTDRFEAQLTDWRKRATDKSVRLGSDIFAPTEQTKPQRSTEKDYVTVDEWRANDIDRDAILGFVGDAKFNAQDDTEDDSEERKTQNIEWAQWSWNPVTGCKHDCPYCYARDIAHRFYPMKFTPALRYTRLTAPANTTVPAKAETDVGFKNVFTCSMADLFGRWVPREWIEAVLAQVRANPQWNFLFLTKFPKRLAEFSFPENAWIGTTVDCQARVKAAEDAFANVQAAVKWLSVEPMIEPLQFSRLEVFDWIVIGGASVSTQTPAWHVPVEWWAPLYFEAKRSGLQVYLKSNLTREHGYPGMETAIVSSAPEEFLYLKTKTRADIELGEVN